MSTATVALSLTQPWATLAITGAKSIETRSWKTPHRGALGIHAAVPALGDRAVLRGAGPHGADQRRDQHPG